MTSLGALYNGTCLEDVLCRLVVKTTGADVFKPKIL
jgi:hypothetical protein